ncbi:hypothetical protein D9M69_577200 [compost metagenome]
MHSQRITIIEIVKALLGLPRNFGIRILKLGLEQLDLGDATILIFWRNQKINTGLHRFLGRSHHLPERTIQQSLGRIIAQTNQLVASLRVFGGKAFQFAQPLIIALAGAIGSHKHLIG